MDNSQKKFSIPEFAVMGHPNEGKSSVVSTLTEDDQIKVSRIPGETTISTQYSVRIDGEEIIRFVDTPGFQVPKQTLSWFRSYDKDPDKLVNTFIKTYETDPFFADECELLGPVAKGAGIIYVVDGSRPVRDDDLAEMEILRLTGSPRMAIINSKTTQKDYTSDWKHEFRKYFNSIRVFNSNTANFTERIKMMESLKAIDQEWEPMLSYVILALHKDWEKRNRLACASIISTIEKCLSFSVSYPVTASTDQDKVREELNQTYQTQIKAFEKKMFDQIRTLFRHRLFEYHLSEYSILKHDLFSKQTWELLGLTTEQLATAGAIIGGTLGVVIDVAAGGVTFGLFTALGGVVGAGSGLINGLKIGEMKRAGIRFGGDKIKLGPNKNLQFLYILMDRALIYYSNMVNRPHGRRDLTPISAKTPGEKQGHSTGFTLAQLNSCAKYFKAVTGRSFLSDKKAREEFERLIESALKEIAS